MNVVFFSPHFPPHYHLFCRHLRAAGASVLGIGDLPFEALVGEVREALTEYYRVADMHDYDALVRACGYFTHRYGKLDRFESLNEYWLDTEARIRDDFNIFGIRSSEIDSLRRKSGMKALFRQAGVATAPGRRVATLEEARALAREAGFPLVCKPDGGVGALNTYRIDDDKALQKFFSHKPPEDYMVEGFVSGELYSFDGLADRDGKLVFYTAHYFSQGIMETVNEDRHIHYYSLRRIPSALEKAGKACVEAFGVRERFFHIEFFRSADGRFTGLEVNLRPPGGYTTDMFNYACDIDIYRSWAELLVQGRTDLDYERKYHCCYASRKNRLRYRHMPEEIHRRWQRLILQAVKVPGVFSSALGDEGYLLRSADLEEILAAVDFIQATVEA
jgi:biotin carboxylase